MTGKEVVSAAFDMSFSNRCILVGNPGRGHQGRKDVY